MRFHTLICGSICWITAVLAPAQQRADRSAGARVDGKPGSTMTLKDLERTKGKTVRHKEAEPIDVRPAEEPTPALRLRFYPARWELKPGQALSHFARAQILLSQIPKETRNLWQSHEWLGDPTEGAPTDNQLKSAVDSLQQVYREMHHLAQAEDFRWDHRLRDIRGPDVYMYLLPDVQEVRTLTRMLILKIRYQVKQQDFDGAISSISDGMRLAEFVGQGETLIQKLVGIAIMSMMRAQITKMISTPGCPNLYWALATIPQPLVSVRDSVLWELNNISNVLPVLAAAETETWTEAEAGRKWSSALEDLDVLSGSGVISDNSFRLALVISSVTFVETARQRLQSAGFPEERLDQLPGLQIVLIDASRELRRMGDDLGKAHLLPMPLARPLAERQQKEFQRWVGKQNRMASVAVAIAGLLYPAGTQAHEAETRSVMPYNRLMTLEALRMHAAGHDGQLPDTLDQLSPVPALPDPYTGKPFGYHTEVVDGKILVRLTADGPRNYKPLQSLRAHFVE